MNEARSKLLAAILQVSQPLPLVEKTPQNEFRKTCAASASAQPLGLLCKFSQKENSNRRRGRRNDEEQRKSASRVYGPPVPAGHNEGFPSGSLFDSSVPPRNGAQGGDGDEAISPRHGDESKGGAREISVTTAATAATAATAVARRSGAMRIGM